jgi:hypothetical protein
MIGIRFLVLAVVAGVLGKLAHAQESSNRPNIVYVILDDVGFRYGARISIVSGRCSVLF